MSPETCRQCKWVSFFLLLIAFLAYSAFFSRPQITNVYHHLRFEKPIILINSTAVQEYKIPHKRLLHPSKSLEDLWFKLQDYFLIRRLGYFDTREKTHISIVFVTMFDIRKVIRPTLYAKLVYSDNTKHCVKLENWTEVGILNVHQKEFFITVLYRTQAGEIHTVVSPLYAMVSESENCTEPMALVPIQNDKPKQRFTYGVCLHKGLYDLNDPQLLVDWVELHIALGAEIITIYLQNVPESYYTVMIPYIERGIVEVLDWNLKPPLIPGYTKHWGQSGTINECIYRNLYRVKYLALVDVDEFIIPQEKRTIIEMLEDLEKHNTSVNPSAFIFYNTLFYNNGVTLPEIKLATKCPNKYWPRYFTHTYRVVDPVFEHKSFFWHKIIVKTAAINAAWYHWPTSVKEGYLRIYYSPVQFGLTHHYRIPPKPKKRCTTSFIMSRYFNQTLQHLLNC